MKWIKDTGFQLEVVSTFFLNVEIYENVISLIFIATKALFIINERFVLSTTYISFERKIFIYELYCTAIGSTIKTPEEELLFY